MIACRVCGERWYSRCAYHPELELGEPQAGSGTSLWLCPKCEGVWLKFFSLSDHLRDCKGKP